ncbi:MAG: hypothetical protein WCY19_07155 [Candidatus Gastranaerophilaceae bacterium]
MGGFDVNFNNKPIIQEAKSMQNDGGAGNLGYFEREEKEGKSERASIFTDEGADSFKKSGENEGSNEDFSIAKWIAQIILSIKDWFKKIFGLS